MLVDTDVLIDALRGRDEAERVLADAAPFRVSVVTYMELIQGVRDKAELKAVRASLAHWGAKVVYVDEPICVQAVLMMERHRLGHALGLPDALIAATALALDETLLSGNEKHYRMIAGLGFKRYPARRPTA